MDRDGDLPPGLQLSWRLRALISSGRLEPGERLPSVRDLAARAGVNVNTARASYRRLEREGLVVSRHGLGTFVTDRAEVAAPQVERLAAEAAAEARETGVDPRDLATAIYASAGIDTGDAEPARPHSHTLPDIERGDEPGTRRELRRQIARLEEELSGYARELRRGDPGHPLLQAKPRVADVSELERTRDALLDQIAEVRDEQARKGKRQRRGSAPCGGDGPPARGAQVAVGLERGDRRPGLQDVARDAALWPGRRPDGLVARQGLLGMSMTGG